MRTQPISNAERRVRQTTWAFADGRFENREVIEWAIALTPEQATERLSLRDLYVRQTKPIREPYTLAWQCIFEFWHAPQQQKADAALVRRELRQGWRQREMIRLIVDAVRPWLKVETARRYQVLSSNAPPKKPRHLRHLLYASISGGGRLSPQDIGLSGISDRDFLFELASSLNASILEALNLAKMIGAISNEMDITNWQVHRVYYVPQDQHPEGGGEPDRYHEGFAPSTKLMFAALERLADIDIDAARRVVASWDTDGWTLYRRLWAAAARAPNLAKHSEVASFLNKLHDREFWIAGSYPEFAELRAVRWNTFSPEEINCLESRLLRGEPAKHVPSGIPKSETQNYKRRHTANELRRIQAGGGTLSAKGEKWLATTLEQLQEQLTGSDLTMGFNQGVRMITRDRTIAQDFDGVATTRLLEELAKSLSEEGWDSRSENAADFIGANALSILKLLGDRPDTSVAAKIWQAFGHRFKPSDLNVRRAAANVDDLEKIPVALEACKAIIAERGDVIASAIDGLTSFIGGWDRLIGEVDDFKRAWLTLWPYAVSRTNGQPDLEGPLNNIAFGTPVGQMMWAMIGMCPTISEGANPFEDGIWPAILSAVEGADGLALLVARYVLIRDISYFYAASPEWATRNLVTPLKTLSSADLWESFSTGNLPSYNLMSQLSEPIVKATMMSELPTSAKADLAERVVWSIIFDRRENKPPAVPLALAQQMLRLGDDHVRAQAVRALVDFLRRNDEMPDQTARFDLAKSIFQDVWPKELTLTSRAVSEELAKFPAAAGDYYAEAAALVLPYLTPFDCWSLWDYGLGDVDESESQFEIVDSPAKAAALLSILDKTVGGEDGAIIPDRIEDVLLHLASIAPKLEKDARFQRLVTLNRR